MTAADTDTDTDTDTHTLGDVLDIEEPLPGPRTGDGVRAAAAAAVTGFVALVVLGGGALAGLGWLLTPSPPDTGSFDRVASDAGLDAGVHESSSGSPAFGHSASTTWTLDVPGHDGPACVRLYRAALAAGWTSTTGLTSATCALPPTEGYTGMHDVLHGPHGEDVTVNWFPPYGTVYVEAEGRVFS